jgi:hypothetical protein
MSGIIFRDDHSERIRYWTRLVIDRLAAGGELWQVGQYWAAAIDCAKSACWRIDQSACDMLESAHKAYSRAVKDRCIHVIQAAEPDSDCSHVNIICRDCGTVLETVPYR